MNMSSSSETPSLRALAKALGIAPSAAHKRKQRGMPTHSIEAARAWELENLDPSRQKGAGLSVASPDDDEPHDADTLAYRRARAARERINAQLAQLELDKVRGKLIAADEAERVVFTAFRTLRDNVLHVPTRVRDRCAAVSDPMLIEQLLSDELGAVLTAFDVAGALTDPDDETEELRR